MPVVQKRAGFDQVANAGDGDHKVFSKEISGKKVVDKLYHKLYNDPLLSAFWNDDLDEETVQHMQEVMMEVAFGEGLQDDDKAYLIEVHEDVIRERGLTERHFDAYLAHFDKTLEELQDILPVDKIRDAKANMRSTRVVFQTGKKK
jgi:truncated hemoglobin YjbI